MSQLMRRPRPVQSEGGATLVEAAIALPLILILLMSIAEFGLAFKDWLTVGHSAREGARAGATFGNDVTANIEILDNVAHNMAIVGIDDPGLQVRIYEPGGLSDTYTYNPTSGLCRAPDDCCRWTPCPDPYYVPANGLSGYTTPTWAPSSRDVSAPTTDRIGVEVYYAHDWLTGVLGIPSPTTFDVAVDYQVEPQVFEV